MNANIKLPDGTRQSITGRDFSELVSKADAVKAIRYEDFTGVMIRLPESGWVWVN